MHIPFRIEVHLICTTLAHSIDLFDSLTQCQFEHFQMTSSILEIKVTYKQIPEIVSLNFKSLPS
jgi:hypothetical protein